MIYFDNASTTQTLPEAAKAAVSLMCNDFGNPSSLHALGISAEREVKKAREIIASALGAEACELVFTSCGSESNNLAIFGAAARAGKARHMVTTAFEHPSVLNAAKKLEAQGFEVTYVAPQADGIIHAEDIEAAVSADTFLVSVMAVNNETGAVADIAEISKRVKRKNAKTLVHTDAVQAFLKIPVNAKKLGADLISISGHKIHAPKGIGALYIKKGIGITPQILGGGQESGMRSGTEPTAQIAAFSAAVSALKKQDDAAKKLFELREALVSRLSKLSGVTLINPEVSAPHILCVSFEKYPSEVSMRLLEEEEIYISSGSACSRGKKSHVLKSLNIPEKIISSAVRISLSRFSTEEEVSAFCKAVEKKLI